MMNHRSLSGPVFGGLALGALLAAGCASVKPMDPPATSPASGTPATPATVAPVASRPAVLPVAVNKELEPERGTNSRDWLSPMPDAVPAKSLKSLDGPAPPFIFAERRASEALDHLEGQVEIR